ncbi:pyridoxal-phosphate dependent enzyme [Weeksella virosa]|uniref:1-aminocyclopropane-1-carboxylate deaminase/D-cysteine desulfhydrase n=1 Tax=Weeksella virosa TaxID=1014 RepID=UPI000E044ED7|nr:pyridoxal-phosphate dependent enzyme [Weeksella virosa]MDK7675232.1 pyridoxal-phosphate dependent enzyme [Weeksella virosa]SUP54933.1 D-cysteine desulfhydrase [Weeksella virosa]
MHWPEQKAEIHTINLSLLSYKNIHLSILREDTLHPTISGNKYRKLKYNLLEANRLGIKKILTFGGAFSNHIAATSAAGAEFGFETIGIIRGDELARKKELNPTLQLAQENGMSLKFIDRTTYRNKTSQSFLEELQQEFGKVYIIPEGGTNSFAVKGCEEIIDERMRDFQYICCPVGTAGTISGIIKTLNNNQIALGFPALKNAHFLHNEIKKYTLSTNYELINDFHFNGYAKISEELIKFVKTLYQQTNIPLDLVYTGKMLFGLFSMIENNCFLPGTNILAIHTGGLQGNKGMGLDFDE